MSLAVAVAGTAWQLSDRAANKLSHSTTLGHESREHSNERTADFLSELARANPTAQNPPISLAFASQNQISSVAVWTNLDTCEPKLTLRIPPSWGPGVFDLTTTLHASVGDSSYEWVASTLHMEANKSITVSVALPPQVIPKGELRGYTTTISGTTRIGVLSADVQTVYLYWNGGSLENCSISIQPPVSQGPTTGELSPNVQAAIDRYTMKGGVLTPPRN